MHAFMERTFEESYIDISLDLNRGCLPVWVAICSCMKDLLATVFTQDTVFRL